MAVGQGALLGGLSYLAVSRETAAGTYQTATSMLDFVSASMKTVQEVKVLEQVERFRTYSKQVQTGKNIAGEVEFYFAPRVTACAYMLQAALGSNQGGVTSATATGETAGAGASSAMTHTFVLGNMDLTYSSLSFNMRKGDSTGGKVFEYHGVRINELGITAEIDEPLKFNCGVVAMKSTSTTNNIESALTVTSSEVLNFISGRLSVESTFASLTSSSLWHVQTMEFSLNNNLKSEADSRRIGSDELSVLPAGMAVMELKCKIRFDTTTAYAAMINNTQFSAEFEFLGDTGTSSSIREGLKLQFPRVYISDAGDPEIGGPDEILTSDVMFKVLRDDTSATGYAMRALLTNFAASI